MGHNLKIEGIYDQRTLKLLKNQGVRDFGFNFSPKSFNFIQEHIFLDDLVPLLNQNDKIYLHFTRSNDPMIVKVLYDLTKTQIKRECVYLTCDEWIDKPYHLENNYFLNFFSEIDMSFCNSKYFSGIILDYNFLENLHSRGKLNNFLANFYTQFNSYLSSEKKVILKLGTYPMLVH